MHGWTYTTDTYATDVADSDTVITEPVSVGSLRVAGCVSDSVLSCNDLLGEHGQEPSADLVALEQAIATNYAELEWTPPLQ